MFNRDLQAMLCIMNHQIYLLKKNVEMRCVMQIICIFVLSQSLDRPH